MNIISLVGEKFRVFLYLFLGCIVFLPIVSFVISKISDSKIPMVVILGYGRDSIMDNIVYGIKEEVKSKGFRSGRDVNYIIQDVDYSSVSVSRMLLDINKMNPDVVVILGDVISELESHVNLDVPTVFGVYSNHVVNDIVNKKSKAPIFFYENDISNLFDFGLRLFPTTKMIGYVLSEREYLSESLKDELGSQGIRVSELKIGESFYKRSDDYDNISKQLLKMKNNGISFLCLSGSDSVNAVIPHISSIAGRLDIGIISPFTEHVFQKYALGAIGIDHKLFGSRIGSFVANLLMGEREDNFKDRMDHSYDKKKLVDRILYDRLTFNNSDNFLKTG